MNFKLLLPICALIVTVGEGEAKAETSGLKVVSVRTYNDGGVHIYFDGPITSACGSAARVRYGSGFEGQSNVLASALTAMSSGRTVTVQTEEAPSGTFCNLIYLRVY